MSYFLNNDYFFIFDKVFSKNFTNEKNYINKQRWYKYVEQDDKKILMYDVSGISAEDNNIEINLATEGYRTYLKITGKTKTEYGEFAVDDRFEVPADYIGKDSYYKIENGILYVIIIPDKTTSFKLQQKK